MSPEDKLVRIRRTMVPSSIGLLLVAATTKGLCYVALGDTEDEVEEALRAAYPQAEFTAGDAELAGWTQQVLSIIEEPGQPVDVPLDVEGTAFQQKVWRALQEIPLGTTVSYGELAQKIGAPKAARAVGHACATNKVALVIPCHRVVHQDGTLGSYYWGLARKKELLRREKDSRG